MTREGYGGSAYCYQIGIGFWCFAISCGSSTFQSDYGGVIHSQSAGHRAFTCRYARVYLLVVVKSLLKYSESSSEVIIIEYMSFFVSVKVCRGICSCLISFAIIPFSSSNVEHCLNDTWHAAVRLTSASTNPPDFRGYTGWQVVPRLIRQTHHGTRVRMP